MLEIEPFSRVAPASAPDDAERIRGLELLARLPAALNAELDPEAIARQATAAARSLLGAGRAWLAPAGAAGEIPARALEGAELSVSLSSKGRLLGVLALGPRVRPYGENDLAMLDTLAHQISIALENARLHAELKRSFYGTVEALAEAIEKKDRCTGGHARRVMHFSECIARALGLGDEESERIRLAALLHDVGKIGVDDSILRKRSALEGGEWEAMQRHPELGTDILGRVEGLEDVAAGMRFHHERWDGKGYPLGMSGETIPLVARVIAVADAYDAMVSTRPYRKGMAPGAALEEIVRHRGTQFDPRVVDAFVLAFERERFGRNSGAASNIS